MTRARRFRAVFGMAMLASCSLATSAPRQGPALGYLLDADSASVVPVESTDPPGQGALVRLVARWAEVETTPGRFDWTALEPTISRLHDAGYRVVLCLTGSHPAYLDDGAPPSPYAGESVARFADFARSAVRTLGRRVGEYEIWDAPDPSAFPPEVYSFVLKATALAARAEAKAHGATIRIAQAAVSAEALEWQKGLWRNDVAAYVDVLPVRVRVGSGPEGCDGPRRVFDEAVEHPPAPEIRAYVESDDARVSSRVAIACLAGPSSAALARLGGGQAEVAREATWMRGLHRILGGGYAAAPPGHAVLAERTGAPVEGGRILARFVKDEDLSTLIVYDASLPPGSPSREGIVLLDIPDARDARIVDPGSGRVETAAVGFAPGAGGARAAAVRLSSDPMVLTYQRVLAPGPKAPDERLDVERTRGLTAEEIIARHQEVQRLQDDRLDRWIARGRLDYHFKLAQAGSTVDVSVESNYYWERGAQLEWEQTDYFVNGNRVTWKTIPEIPFIQPEKVVTLPLDLTLDRTYAYRLAGEDTVDGRDAYVLAFEPADPAAPSSLYRGRVWIDRASFERLRFSVVQTGLEAPVLSNEEWDDFGAVAGPDGVRFRLVTRSAGQQLWTIAGRNLVVARELTFTSIEIDPPREDFERRRRAAYASSHPMLRDTDDGYRYLERNEDGSRTLKPEMDTSQVFAAAGAYKDASISSVVPLAGFNWFDYDLAKKNIQANVFFAGVLLFGTVSDPTFLGSKVDATAETALFGLKRSDKVYRGDAELLDQRLEGRSQSASVRFGFPVGKFVKITLVGDLEVNSFFRADETAPGFVVPRDHRLYTGTVRAEFNRRGTTLSLSASGSRRSGWGPWGIPDSGGAFPEFDPSHRTFATWRASAFKEWYLPRFQKVRIGADYLDGTDLDRFSKFQFSFFGGAGLAGFAGSGVRFDRGAVARAGYSFNLLEAVRFDATLESARVEDDASVARAERFTGVGLSANVIGPWKSILSVSYGRAVASDIPDLLGQQEFLLTVYKLF